MSCTDNPNALSTSGTGAKEDAERFLTDAEKRLLDLNIKAGRADWVKSTFITDDTEALAAEANENLIAGTTELAEQSRRYESLDLSPENKRKLKLLKLALTLPAPKDPAKRAELTKLTASMEGDYGKGKYCPDGDKRKCLGLTELEDIIGQHPAVSQVAVIGTPHPKWGEAVTALVVLRGGQTVTGDELSEMVAQRKGSFQAPKRVEFIDAIPQTPVGKPDKKALRAKYGAKA